MAHTFFPVFILLVESLGFPSELRREFPKSTMGNTVELPREPRRSYLLICGISRYPTAYHEIPRELAGTLGFPLVNI